jgi:hypothetical protein
MAKTIIIKLTCAGYRTGPFDIYDNLGNSLGKDISKENIIDGYTVSVDDAIVAIILQSVGKCHTLIELSIDNLTVEEIAAITFTPCNTASLWRHLTNISLYNNYYGNIEPYVIEYPFAFQSYDEILQSVKDFTKAYRYFASIDGVYNTTNRIETDDQWFNKAILYNGQQCSGLLELVPKPINNLQGYLSYPIYNTNSKTIIYTKSDNFYQYNTFWGLVKNKNIPLFLTSCESLSIDKVLNQANMDYGKRSFKKEPLRSKSLKVRHILDNSSTAHLVSQFIITEDQISYK